MSSNLVKASTSTDSIPNMVGQPGLHFLGRFHNGKVLGHFWIGLQNNGFIHGVADENGHATGDDVAFIYPDGETALKGRFENTYMKKARNVDVTKYGCDENGMFIAKGFTEPLTNDEFFYDPPTNESFGGGSKYIKDPYEVKTVSVADSSIPNSGEGVFLKRDLLKDQIACFYSLYRYREPDQWDQIFVKNKMYNTSNSDDYRRECTKYIIHLVSYEGVIAIPPEFDINPLPTIGPKVNHHFKFNNALYMEAEHPRWGLITSVVPVRDIKAGEELFTHYQYKDGKQFPEDHPWYFETELIIKREERLQKEEKDKSRIKRNGKKKSDKTKKSSKKHKSEQ